MERPVLPSIQRNVSKPGVKQDVLRCTQPNHLVVSIVYLVYTEYSISETTNLEYHRI